MCFMKRKSKLKEAGVMCNIKTDIPNEVLYGTKDR